MKILIKNKKELACHNKTMETKVIDAPFNASIQTPRSYPCIVVSWIPKGVNGYSVWHEFVYESDFSCNRKIRD